MALQAVGLRTYIWNNNLKSLLLLAGFPVLLFGIAFALLLLVHAADAPSAAAGLSAAAAQTPAAGVVSLGIAGVWFAIAYVSHQKIIDLSVGSREATREAEPELYNLLENLCISRGMPTPQLRIIETEAMNAFASGLTEEKSVVTVTRGLTKNLDRQELEAVLAHELSHIRHRDVRLLVIAAVFVGIISFVGEMMFRGLFRASLRPSRRSSSRGNGGVLVLIALLIIVLAYVLAIVVRFALSRRREFLADAGAVEMTKNPDAMIRALQRISGRSELGQAPDEVREMFFDNHARGFAGLFATHPPIDKRIEALALYAGGRDLAAVAT